MKQYSKELRENATFAERLLWKYLCGRQLKGYSFLRQKAIDRFIVDFYCSPLRLVIEIDGLTHDGKASYDKRRENRLKALGLNVLRLDGLYVIHNITGALEILLSCIEGIERNTSP